MSDLAEFLLARIAEDEAAARAAIAPGERHPYGDRAIPETPPDRMGAELRGYVGGPLGDHAAVWHPVRVLAECEAKRRIIAEHRRMDGVAEAEYDSDYMEEGWQFDAKAEALEYAMRALALPYAAHPEYRQEWRP